MQRRGRKSFPVVMAGTRLMNVLITVRKYSLSNIVIIFIFLRMSWFGLGTGQAQDDPDGAEIVKVQYESL